MRNINWWLTLAAALCLFSFGALIVSASLGLWDCAIISGFCLIGSYLMGRAIEDASK